MNRPCRIGASVVWSLVAWVTCLGASSTAEWLSAPRVIAPGVTLYTSADPTLMTPPGPQALTLLQLDPSAVTLSSAHAGDGILGLEPVDVIARRHGAIAAVNAGFFNTRNGDPEGLLKLGGELVSDTTLPRGVVAIGAPAARLPQTLAFDQLAVTQRVRYRQNGRDVSVPVDGVDTTRGRGKLMLYTPKYHADTDTAPNGIEIVARGTPLTVREVRVDAGHTPIPAGGIVLSYGGLALPPPLAGLTPGTRLWIDTEWRSTHGVPASTFDGARDIVNGAGLLRRAGTALTDWTSERLNRQSFVDARHPRTLIGRDARGFVWLVAVDGRQPDYAGGMTFAEMQALADRLSLTDALNLDGGGSTTVVVGGRIVNRPSDPTGPRPVSDVILVHARGAVRR